jgi:hypothetical protein
MSRQSAISAAAVVQRRLWGTDPQACCSAGGARAAEAVGRQAVREALRPALAPFQDPETGAVTMDNTFRWVAGRAAT